MMMMTNLSFSKLRTRTHTLKVTNKKTIIILAVTAVTVMGFCWMIRLSSFFFFSSSSNKEDYSLIHNKPTRNQSSLLAQLETARLHNSNNKNYTANNEEKDPLSSSLSSLASWPYLPVMDDEEAAHANFWKEEYGLRRGPAINGIDFLWQYNNSRGASFAPEGILFVAHGCHHNMTHWWPSTGPCPECIGLPEEVAIVDIALKIGLLVVVISSMDRSRQCWSKQDGPRVAQVLQGIHGYFSARRGGHDSVKILAFGACSGGHFVSSYLPKAMQTDYTNADSKLSSRNVAPPPRIHGYISQIAAGLTRHDEDSLPVAAVFITMNRDPKTDEKARRKTLALQKMGVATRHVRLEPLPLMDDFFSTRINHVDFATSRDMVRALQNADMLSSSSSQQHDHGSNHDLVLREDPRQTDWRSVLAPFAARLGDSMVADESSLSEVLNVAWGVHEMSRDSVHESLEFILSSSQNPPTTNSSGKTAHL